MADAGAMNLKWIPKLYYRAPLSPLLLSLLINAIVVASPETAKCQPTCWKTMLLPRTINPRSPSHACHGNMPMAKISLARNG